MVKKILSQILSCLFSMAICLGGWGLGLYLTKKQLLIITKPQSIALLVVTGVLIIAIIAINLTILERFSKKILNSKVKARHDLGLKLKEEIEKDYQKAEKQVAKSIHLFTLYKIIILLLTFTLCFATGLIFNNEENMGGAIAINIIMLCSIWGVVNSFFPNSWKDEKLPKEAILTKEEFPNLYKIIADACKKCNYAGKVTAVYSDNGISIGKHKNGLLLAINAEEFAFLTENELYAVLLHEFAHHVNQDTHRRNKFYSFIEKSENLPDNPILYFGNLMFLHGIAQRISFNAISFETIASRKKEIKADDFVKTQDVAQEYINATAKASLYSIYSEYPWAEITFETYKNEEPVSDYAQRNHSCFLQKVALYGDKWHFTLKNELPARIDSHPTFAMRMKNFGVEEYQANFNIDNDSLAAEREKLFNKVSAVMADRFKQLGKEYFKNMHKGAYLDRVEAMNRYDKFDSEWSALSDSDLIECAQAFMFIDDQKAIKILNEVINRTNSSFACYILGSIYSREYNDECIELFKKAAVDPSATNEAFDEIGKYALKTGNQKLIEEYRATVVDKSEYAEEENLATLFAEQGLTAPTENHAETVEEIKQNLRKHWGEYLNGLYVAVRETNAQTQVYYIALDVDKKLKGEKLQIAYEESCYFINRMSIVGKKFYIFFTGKEFNVIKKLNGACIYIKDNKTN